MDWFYDLPLPLVSLTLSERLRSRAPLGILLLLLLLLQHFSSPDFWILSFCPISIKFSTKVHLVVRCTTKDFFLQNSKFVDPQKLKTLLKPSPLWCSISISIYFWVIFFHLISIKFGTKVHLVDDNFRNWNHSKLMLSHSTCGLGFLYIGLNLKILNSGVY